MRYGVVIPSFNEVAFIGGTIASLGMQADQSRSPFALDRLEVVVVDTPGSDGTAEVAREFGSQHPKLKVTVLTEPEPSMVAARIRGVEYLLSQQDTRPEVLVSADADTTFPPDWLASVDRLVAKGYRMVSTAGCFEHQFWLRCTTLARRYAEQVGTIFFNSNTIQAVVEPGDVPLFTAELFHRFGRPVSDCGFAITTDFYRQLGGIRREYYDHENRRPILAVGWPLMFRAEMAGESIAFMPSPEYETSARRLLHEPEALFSGTSYLNEIESFRSTADDQHTWLERFADRLDMSALRRYVIKNYILQQCILRPERIMRNHQYFGEAATDIVEAIAAWHPLHPEPGTRNIFEFADQLADAYGELILSRVRELAMDDGVPL